MQINYQAITDEILKQARAHGFAVSMYDAAGNAVASGLDARHLYMQPQGIFMTLPDADANENQITVYIGSQRDSSKFNDMIASLRITMHMQGIAVVDRRFAKNTVAPSDFVHLAHDAQALKARN